MLQNIRQNIQGPTTKIVVWLIVISFSIFGIESILVGGGGGGVAEVNGEEIGPGELQQAINTQKRRLIAMMGDNIDPAVLDDELLRPQALESLINRELLMQSAQEMDLTVSKREVGALVANMEQFQIEGKFSPQLFTSVLSSAGYTPAYFKQSLRDDITLTQLRSGLIGSEFSTPLELSINARLDAEQRDLQYLTIPLDGFLSEQEVTQEEVEAYYTANRDRFLTPETVELDYIELTAEDFFAPVEEEAVLEAYQLERDSAQYQTENRVSHILFEQGSEESEEALQQRIAAAQAALAEGREFAEVAGEYSDDVGSAASGGDLGFSSGDTFPPEMEEAISQLEPGIVSQPVFTDAGVHLIKLTERREGSPPSLEELRPRIEEQLQLSQAREQLLLTVERLKDLAFNAEDLAGPARDLELEVERSGPVSRNQASGLFANPSLLAAAFSEEVLEAGYNSEVVELGGDRFVVLHAHRHNAPEVRPLADVRDEIATLLREEAARVEQLAAAQNVLDALRDGIALEEVASENGYEVHAEPSAGRDNTGLPPEVLARGFSLPAPSGEQPVFDLVISPGGDARIITLSNVQPGSWSSLEQAEQLALRRQLTGEYANLLNNEYQSGLRESADIAVR